MMQKVYCWLVFWTLNQVVWVYTLPRAINVLFPNARHFTLTVPLFTQVFKWVFMNLLL